MTTTPNGTSIKTTMPDLVGTQGASTAAYGSVSKRFDGSGNKFSKQKKRYWNDQEDLKLKELVERYGAKNWKRIADSFENRTDVQCLHRW